MAKMTEIHKKYACFRKLNCEKCLKIKGKCVRLFSSIYGIEIYQIVIVLNTVQYRNETNHYFLPVVFHNNIKSCTPHMRGN